MATTAEGSGKARPRSPASRHGLSADSPLVGGAFDVEAGAEEQPAPEAPPSPDLRELRELVPAAEPGRQIDDWGRSQRVYGLVEPLLDFYYRYWFRVETQGIDHLPSEGGALLVANRSGALPPDAPMIMQAIRHEHARPRPLYMLGEHWLKGYPGIGMLANKVGLVGAHPANAHRLLCEEQRLALVFPEAQKGARKLYWQRYKLRRFGRGGFVRTAIRAGVPIVPVAVIGAEEAMPLFASVPLLPAKFRISFLEPVDLSAYAPEDADELGLVQQLAEQIRGEIQAELDELVMARRSVWFG
jgi:1-acyl-sn-glycerol-3-phosphate acyltransferase